MLKNNSIRKLLFCLSFFVTATIMSQQKVRGSVSDSTTGDMLPQVTIQVKGTSKGTTTDFDGNYSISVKSDAVLIFSYIGFKTQEIIVNDKSVIDVKLLEDTNSLNEVVLVGYGSSLKKDLTSAVSTVKVEELKQNQSPQIEQALGGRVAGVEISSVNSEPGAGPRIRIRGGNSINGDNAPLLVVDGILGGDFQSLNVNDIESMQVLKDASATSIYGSRGANGVIIVSTKKGKLGKLKIGLTSNTGIQNVRKKIDLFNAQEAIQVLQDREGFNFPEDIDNISNPILSGNGTDWQDEIFQVGQYQNYHLNIAGGSKKIKAFTSLDYINQEGVVIESGYKKLASRTNLTYKVSDKFKISSQSSFYNTKTNRAKTNGGFGSFGSPITLAALLQSPIVPVFAEDGSFNGPLSSSSTRDNPVSIARNSSDENDATYLQNTIATSWKITPKLTHDFSAALVNSTSEQRRYRGKELLRALNVGEARIANRKREFWQIKNLLTYNNTFKEDHKISVLAGYEISNTKTFRSSIDARGFATEVLNVNNIGLASDITNIDSFNTEFGLVSYLSRATYNYKGTYLASISGRLDASTKFAKNNKWATFPSASLAWVVSNENFLKDNKVINFLKVRTSYGKSGSQGINPYQSLASFETGQVFSLDGVTENLNGVVIDRVANPNLRWETTSQYDFGIDLELYDSRISLNYDYFNKKTEDLLFNRRLLAITGIERQLQNIGSLENKGHEFGIDAKILTGKLKWGVSSNITFIKNKVLNLGGEDNIFIKPVSGSRGSGFDSAAILRVGEAVGNFYGFVADGIFNDQAEVDASTQDGAVLGGVKYKDTDGNGVVDEEDRTIIGNALPDFTFGMNHSLSYNNFDLNISLQGAVGNDVIWLDRGRINTPDQLNGWTPTNTTTNIPRNSNWGSETNSNYVLDGSFLKVKNISLGYNFNKTIVEKIGLQALRIYASAIDPLVFTKYEGFDPEVNSQSTPEQNTGNNLNRNVALGFDEGAYPGVSQYLLGLNITF